jgi:hypothetical protein
MLRCFLLAFRQIRQVQTCLGGCSNPVNSTSDVVGHRLFQAKSLSGNLGRTLNADSSRRSFIPFASEGRSRMNQLRRHEGEYGHCYADSDS